MYQFETSSIPSGLACTARMMQSSRMRIVSASLPLDQLVHRLDQLGGAQHLGRVQPAVDPDDRPPFLRQRARLFLGEPVGERQLPGDLLVPVELRDVGRRRDDRHQLGAALRRLADVHELHPVRLRGELAPVLLELGVVRELVVVTDVEPEVLLRRRHLPLRRDGRRGRQQQRDRRGHDRRAPGSHTVRHHRCLPESICSADDAPTPSAVSCVCSPAGSRAEARAWSRATPP